jgi:hypothetical protein
MRIGQLFTKQHTKAAFRTIPSTMNFGMADETTIRQEESICVVIIQTGESVKRNTVHGYEDGGGEQRLFVEGDPVDAMVI